jgi:tetratricopeptide (TPR) repeat protein
MLIDILIFFSLIYLINQTHMKVKKYCQLLLYFFLLSSFCFSQSSPEIDSLLSTVNSIKNDTQKVSIFNHVTQLYCAIDFDKALYYNQKALHLATKANLPRKLAEAYNIQGIIFLNQGKIKEADTSLNKAIELHKKNHNTKGIASGYGNLGAMYYMIGSYNKSLSYNLKCLKLNEEMKDKNGVAITLLNIANIYFIQKNYAEAKKYYNGSRLAQKELNHLHDELSALNNIAIVLIAEEKPDEALLYLDTIKKAIDGKGDDFLLENAYIMSGKGICYKLKGEYSKAHEYMNTAKELYKKLNNSYKEIEITGIISALYIKEGDYKKALESSFDYLNKAKSVDAKQHEMDAYQFIYESYSGLNDHENALKYHKRFIAQKDSVLNNENLKNLSELETKYETEKKESENKLLMQTNLIQQLRISRSNYFIVVILTALAFVILIALLFIRQSKLNSQQRTMLLEQRLLRSQMNPHFIFNSLIAIESYIYKNEPKEAGRYLSGFAKLMRMILENSREEYISLSKEIKTLEYYLELQKNRFDNSFDYVIELPPGFDPDSIAIPPMLAQPFIENSIEHGLKNNDKKGKITIRFSLKNDQLIFEVIDNGIGLERSMAESTINKTHRSMATTITMERLSVLNKRKRKKIKLNIDEIKDSLNAVLGTQVSFAIPFKAI